jgi:predicted membrane-bound spermidine synthase
VRFVPFIAFFLSGSSSLIFQLIWSRLLHHIFGSSSVAISSVVSVFMGGLALGTWLFGKFADRLRRPLLVYASAELGVGLWGLVVPIIIKNDGWLAQVNGFLRGSLGAESTQFMIVRFLCIVPILIIPTTLMGSTLPLLARHFVETKENASRASARVGALYAINTFGAVIGIFLAGFVLMPKVGVSLTNIIAVSINFLLAAFIFSLRHKLYQPIRSDASAPTDTEIDTPVGRSRSSEDNAQLLSSRDDEESLTNDTPRLTRSLVAATFGISGAVSLLYEVVWSRALINTIGASVYSFALILMTFLIGIASGSAIASSIILRNRNAPLVLGIASSVLSVLATAPLAVRHSALSWAIAACVCIGLIAGIGQLDVARRKRQLLLIDAREIAGQGFSWGLTTLVIPFIGAILVIGIDAHRLAQIGFSVVCCLCVFLYLLAVFRRNRILLLALIQLFIGSATLVSDVWADKISLTFAGMVAPLYDSLPDNVHIVMILMSFTAALCVLPAALGMGAMFPLTMRIWSSGGNTIGRDVGIVYTGNTIGSIVGAWLPGFVLMPIFGMQGTLHIGIALNLILCLVLVLIAPLKSDVLPKPADDLSIESDFAIKRRFPSGQTLIVYFLSAAVPVLVAFLYIASTSSASILNWNISKMTLGTFRISLAKSVLDQEAWGEPELVYYRDGVSTTVTVERWGRHYALKNNGKVDASNGDDMTTQIMVAGYPLLMHPKGATGLDVAIVGYGSGVTVGAALQFPVRSVDVVELERSVIEGSRFFSSDSHIRYVSRKYPFVSMPRLTVINDDGRNYLAATKKKYDVIVSEPSNPWLTGVSDLFTTDYFRITKKRLRPQGIYCQWVQLYELSPENVKVVYRTFASFFKHVIVFSAEELASDTILLGSDSPLPIDLEQVSRNFALPGVKKEIARASIRTPFDLFARNLFASRQEVLNYAQIESRQEGKAWKLDLASDNHDACPPKTCKRETAPLNTDDNALIEFAAPKDLIGFERYAGYLDTVYAPVWPYGRISEHVAGFGKGQEAADNFAKQAAALVGHGRKGQARVFVELSKKAGRTENSARTLDMLALLMSSKGEPLYRFKDLIPDSQLNALISTQRASGVTAIEKAFDRQDFKEALAQMRDMPISFRMQSGPFVRFLYGYLQYKNGNHSNVMGELEELLRDDEDFVTNHTELFYFLARSYDITRHFSKAVFNMRTYIESQKMKMTNQKIGMARLH